MGVSFRVHHSDPYQGKDGGPPKEISRLIQARAATINQHAGEDEGWAVWSGRRNRRFQLGVFLSGKPGPSSLSFDHDSWYGDLNLDADHFCELPVGPQIGLRLVAIVEAVLEVFSRAVGDDPPTSLRRTKRELEWLADGGTDPGPGTLPPLRVRRPSPMPVERFWELVSATVDERTGAFLLPWKEADKFTARMRLLIEDLDSADHAAHAESVMGYLSADVWENVRASVVSLGREMYEHVRVTPAVLGELITTTEAFDGGEHDLGEALLYLEGSDSD